MAKRLITQRENLHGLVESIDKNIFVREPDSDVENFAIYSCSESINNVTEPATETDDKQLWSESDDVPLQEYVTINIYKERKNL